MIYRFCKYHLCKGIILCFHFLAGILQQKKYGFVKGSRVNSTLIMVILPSYSFSVCHYYGFLSMVSCLNIFSPDSTGTYDIRAELSVYSETFKNNIHFNCYLNM